MDEETQEWFIDHLNSGPEWARYILIPAMNKRMEAAHSALHQADRSAAIEEIKYAVGRFDGVKEFFDVIRGLRMSDKPTKKPAGPGLMARIFGKEKTNV